MMYHFMTLTDSTEIVHSEYLPDETVKVYIEKLDEKDGFHNATCILPAYEWKDINGFTQDQIAGYQELIASVAHLIN